MTSDSPTISGGRSSKIAWGNETHAKLASLQSEKTALKASLDKAHKMLDNYLVRAANAEREAAIANARVAAMGSHNNLDAKERLKSGQGSTSEEEWNANSDGNSEEFEDALSKSDAGLDDLDVSKIDAVEDTPETRKREFAVAKLGQAMSSSLAASAARIGPNTLDLSSELFASHVEELEHAHEHELMELKEAHSRELLGMEQVHNAALREHTSHMQLAQIQQVQNLMAVLGLPVQKGGSAKEDEGS